MQLYSEFHRITNLNLPSTFYASLDKYTPQLLRLYKKRKTGPFGQNLEAIMMAFKEQVIFYFYFMHYIIECEQWTLTSLHTLSLCNRTKMISVQLEQQPWLAYHTTWRRIHQKSSEHARYLWVLLLNAINIWACEDHFPFLTCGSN